MADASTPTVDSSLAMLADAVAKAADDLGAVAPILDRARRDISARNTAVSRDIVAGAKRAIDHLAATDAALRDVLKALEARD